MDKHVVFVHGLRRANVQVWVSSGKPPEVWPLWLEADIEKLGIWSVEHNSALTLWRGNSMPLVDRANNILALLLSEERLKQGDISFVVHSFGGLIFEQLLRTASDRSSATQQNVADLAKCISRVTFLGTPHLGADLATWAGRVRLLARNPNVPTANAPRSATPPGFAVDCLETLEEIAIRYASLYRSHDGGELGYIPALNDSPSHIKALASLLRRHLRGWVPGPRIS